MNGRPSQVHAVLNVAGVFVSTGTDPFSAPVELLASSSDCGVGKWVGRDGFHDRAQVVACEIADANGDGIADRIDEQGILLGTGLGFGTVRIPFPPGLHRQ